MKRVLIWSNAPWTSTGYGQQTDHLIKALNQLGYHAAVLANWGAEYAAQTWGEYDTVVYAKGFQRELGEDVLPFILAKEKPDLILTLCNEWTLNADWWASLAAQHNAKLVCWSPVEQSPIPPKVKQSPKHTQHCLLYTSPSPRDRQKSRMPSSA